MRVPSLISGWRSITVAIALTFAIIFLIAAAPDDSWRYGLIGGVIGSWAYFVGLRVGFHYWPEDYPNEEVFVGNGVLEGDWVSFRVSEVETPASVKITNIDAQAKEGMQYEFSQRPIRAERS